MFTRVVRRVGLFSILLLSAGCTESKESPIAKHRELATSPSPIVVHSEFGIDPSAALTGGDPDLGYNVGLQSPIGFPGPDMQFTPPINGGVELLVWSDGGDLYGERLSGDGAPLEPGQYVISASDGSQTHPRVAPIDIEQYAVVFEDDRNGGSIYVTHADIYGNVMSETPIVEGVGVGISPAVGCASIDPTYGAFGCFVVWRNGSEIMGEPFDWDGGSSFLLHEPMAISNAAGHGSAVVSAPAIAASGPSSAGKNYLIAWNESPIGGSTVDVHAARLTVPDAIYPPPDSGQPPPVILEQPEITVSQDTAALTAPSVATGYLVSWVKSTGASTGAVVAARVALDGSVLDSPPLSLGSVGTLHGASPPSSMSSGLVVWVDDQSSVNGARVTQTGEVVPLGRIASAPPGGSLAHARGMTPAQYLPSTGGGALDIVVWTQNGGAADPGDRLFAATQNADGLSFNPPFGVVGAGTPVGAGVAGNASEFLVLWSGNGIRIGRDGRALDAHPFAAPTGAVTSDGTDFAVVWSASGDIHGSKIGRNGAVGPDVTIIAGPNPEDSAAIASNGSNYVLVWLEHDPANEGTTILHEGVLDLDLHVQQTITLASDQSDFLLSPAVASDGTGYMAVWSEESICSPPFCSVGAYQIYGIPIQADGSLSPDNGFWFPVGEGGLDEFSPSIGPAGAPGAGYVVAYTERSGNANGEIRALHVWPPVTIGNPNLYEDSPSVAGICDESLVTWTRGDYTVSDYPPGPRDLIGATIANGTATEIPISSTTNDEANPATFGLGSSALVVYSTFAGVRARLVTSNCGGTSSDGGDGGGQQGAGGQQGGGGLGGGGQLGSGGSSGTSGLDGGSDAQTGAGGQLGGGGSSGTSGFDGGSGAQTGSGGQGGSPDASGSGGASIGGSGGASTGDAGLDASGSGGASSGGSGGASTGDAGLDASGSGGASGGGGSGTGGEEGGGGHAGHPGGKGGHAGRGGGHGGGKGSGEDGGTEIDGGPGHGHGRGMACQTMTHAPSSTPSSSLLALVALSIVRRRGARGSGRSRSIWFLDRKMRRTPHARAAEKP